MTTPARPSAALELLRHARVGYATFSPDLSHPAYRRRFGFYARERGIRFELASPRERYDVVVVHHSADLTTWRGYDKSKIVFDYNDSYLREPQWNSKRILRGLLKFASRQTKRLALSYRKAYQDTIARSAAVVCCTEEQARDVSALCSNVHEIVDFWSDRDAGLKTVYAAREPFHLVWEGLPNLDGFRPIAAPLGRIARRHQVQLHLITNIVGARYLRTFWRSHTITRAKAIIPSPDVFLYEWNVHLISTLITACDLALIPIDMTSAFAVSKPANKLLQFWRIAMPVLTSRTPEYARMMRRAGLEMTCDTPDEWESALECYMRDESARAGAGRAAKAFVESEFSNEALMAQWDAVMSSVL